MRRIILDLFDLARDFIYWYRNSRFEWTFVICLNQMDELLWYEERIKE